MTETVWLSSGSRTFEVAAGDADLIARLLRDGFAECQPPAPEEDAAQPRDEQPAGRPARRRAQRGS